MIVEANRTILPTSRKVKLYDQNEILIAELKEKRLLKKALRKIPLLNIIEDLFVNQKEKYDIYINGINCGNIIKLIYL
jgi:hypothetical protein